MRQHQLTLLVSLAGCFIFVQGHSALHDAESCGLDSSSQCSRIEADNPSLDKSEDSTTADAEENTSCDDLNNLAENETVEFECADSQKSGESAEEEFDESPVEREELPDVEELLTVEKDMLHFMSQYIQNETERLQMLSSNLRHWLEVSNFSMADPEEYLSVYLNCFHLLKRMAFDVHTDLLNYSLYDSQLSEQDLNQWDYLSKEHHLLSFANKSPISVDQLHNLDTFGILTVVNSNPDLYATELTQVTEILKESFQRHLEFFGILNSREDITDALETYLEHLEVMGQEDLSRDLLAVAETVYPSQEEPAGILMEEGE